MIAGGADVKFVVSNVILTMQRHRPNVKIEIIGGGGEGHPKVYKLTSMSTRHTSFCLRPVPGDGPAGSARSPTRKRLCRSSPLPSVTRGGVLPGRRLPVSAGGHPTLESDVTPVGSQVHTTRRAPRLSHARAPLLNHS